MKHTTSFTLAAFSVAAVLAFSNCKKEHPEAVAMGLQNGEIPTGTYTPVPGDRIDEIVNGLALDNYSLSFDQAIPKAGITRTAYGADSYLAFADPQDLICPEPFRLKQKRIPIWRIPKIIQPTCPDMIIDIARLSKVRDLLVKADPYQFEGLNQYKFAEGGGFIATEKFSGQFAKMQLDKIDGITNDLDGAKFLMLNTPGDYSGGFTRNFYGYADLNAKVFKPYRTNLKVILKPKLKGCFDPIILSTIKERLQKMDPVAFKGLYVTQLEQDKSIGVLASY